MSDNINSYDNHFWLTRMFGHGGIHDKVDKEQQEQNFRNWVKESCNGYCYLNEEKTSLIQKEFVDTAENLHFVISMGLFDLIPLLPELKASKTDTFTCFDTERNMIYENWTAFKLVENIVPDSFTGKKNLLEILA